MWYENSIVSKLSAKLNIPVKFEKKWESKTGWKTSLNKICTMISCQYLNELKT